MGEFTIVKGGSEVDAKKTDNGSGIQLQAEVGRDQNT